MKKNIKYLIIGIIALSVIILVFNTVLFNETTINMTPTPDVRDLPPKLREEIGYEEKPFIIEIIDDIKLVKVIKEQKGLLLMDLGLSVIFTALYALILCKKDILNYNEKNTIYFIIMMIIISLIIALHIYLKYNVQTIS